VPEIVAMPAWELRDAMAAGDLPPVEVMEQFLARIERLEPVLHAFITVDAERAMDQARRAQAAIAAGEPIGPLHGVPVGVKDNLWAADMPTTSGSALFAAEVPPADSVTVERIRAAGGIVVGKTNMPELAVWPRTVNRVAPECVNPWDPDRVSGASSGGSGAAAAAAEVPLAIGTDGGGSTRLPAALCGVVGVQPSKGVVPSWGRLGEGQFAGIGPMARDVRDAARLLTVISGPDARDPLSDGVPHVDVERGLDSGVDGCRIAWLATMGDFEPDPAVTPVVAAALADLEGVGARVDEPGVRFDGLKDHFWALNAGRVLYEGVASPLSHPAVLEAFGDPEGRARLSPYLVALIDGARVVSEDEYHAARAWRDDQHRTFEDLWTRYDLVAVPTAPYVAPRRPADPWAMPWETMDHYITNTALANILRLTAVSVPAGFVEGLPVGLQLIGPRRSEALALRACHALERVRPWVGVRPKVW
jgi:Asp-tRNA(Asn)/Glu-tRNA(Gln) amidotransferase A subunit family amidase